MKPGEIAIMSEEHEEKPNAESAELDEAALDQVSGGGRYHIEPAWPTKSYTTDTDSDSDSSTIIKNG
jgi:hypothetical protein